MGTKALTRRELVACLTLSAASAILPPARAKPLVSRPISAFVLGMTYVAADTRFWLSNTRPDAELIASSLRALPAREVDLLIDEPTDRLPSSLNHFLGAARGSEVTIFYVSGHGVQIKGQNFLLSSDGKSLIDLASLIELLRNGARTLICFIDACRNNPFSPTESSGTTQDRSIKTVRALRAGPEVAGFEVTQLVSSDRISSGLSRFDLMGSGLKVVFATDPNNVAFDSTDPDQRNGPFALALSQRIREKVTLDEMLAAVTKDVRRQTGGTQTPWQQGSLEQTIYLAGPPARFGDGKFDNMPSP